MSIKLEMAALAGTAILIITTAPQLSRVSRSVKWVHWSLMGSYSLVGVGGLRFLLRFCVNHRGFLEQFSQTNVLGVSPDMMQDLAIGFGVLGSVFCFAVLELGRFSRRGRFMFTWLVVPNSILYPIVMVTASGLVGRFNSTVMFSRVTVLLFVGLACFSIWFYRSRTFTAIKG